MKLHSNRAAMVAGTLLAAVTFAPRASATEWTRNYTVTGRANVRIDTNDGGVRVSTSDSKNVEFRVEYEGYEMDKNLHVEARQSGDHVELVARVTGHWGFSWGGHGRRLHIDVGMPKDRDFHAPTRAGAGKGRSAKCNCDLRSG